MPLQLQRRAVLHNINKVFRPSDQADDLHRNKPVSIEKLDQQDMAFQDVKCCLGLDHGTTSKTLSQALHRQQKALTVLRDARNRTRIGQRPWQSLVCQLRSLQPGRRSTASLDPSGDSRSSKRRCSKDTKAGSGSAPQTGNSLTPLSTSYKTQDPPPWKN
jgi:hypothetical protein